MQPHTKFIFGISIHLAMVYFNVYMMMMIIIMSVIYFYLKLMLFSLAQCQCRKMHLEPLGSHTMFILGILVHHEMVYLDV